MRWLNLVCAFALACCLTSLAAQPAGRPKPKELQWTHAFDLSCRPFGKANFEKDTPKFGVEAFRDNNNGLGLYISQTGSIALGGGFQDLKIPLTSKGPDWITGLDLPAREAGVKEFKKDTKTHSMEIFRDPNVGNWLFITEKGNLAATVAKGAAAGGSKAPKWVHSVDLLVRKGGNREWKDALKYGIEVYRDSNSGNLVYICQTGQIAIVAEATETKSDGKAPEWMHGLDLACRKFDEPDFSKKTRKFGVEIFRDENNGNLMFITETGSLAVMPGNPALKAPTPIVSEPSWTHGLNVKVPGHRREGVLRKDADVRHRGVPRRQRGCDDLCERVGEHRGDALRSLGECTMILQSSAFVNGAPIPQKYTADGADVSPPLAWSDAPENTQFFALICDDPDAPRGTWVHWVVMNLPADAVMLPEALPTTPALPQGAAQGKNDFGKFGYGGPSPPKGKPHRYFFKLYALDGFLKLAEGATKAQVEQAMKGHVLAEATWMGTYQRS